jgi:hypothetical protein
VELIAMLDVLVRVDVEPPLPPLLRWTRVPAEGQCLKASVRELNKILLERPNAEGVGDLVFLQDPIRPIGSHHELPVPSGEL